MKNMDVFSQFIFTFIFVAVFVCSNIDGESLRQRIFKSLDEPCRFDQYRCHNNECIPRTKMCNGVHDCSDNSDEWYCSKRGSPGDCPRHQAFFCGKSNFETDKCIPLSWKCDSLKDCTSGRDEEQCTAVNETVTPGIIHKAKYRAVNWTYQLRKDDHSTSKWGSDVSRIAVALYLSDDSDFKENRTIRDEISYEVNLDLLSRLALNKIEDITSTELAHYIQAFLVTCIDPRKFYILDLVSELRKRVDAQNYTNPLVMLALCNAGERITYRDAEKLISVFRKAHRELWTDTQALAVLALECAAEQPNSFINWGYLGSEISELKKRQYQNGTVENLKTTALLLQALFASGFEANDDNFDDEKAFKQILHSQQEDGSFGNFPNTYYVLPLLTFKSLVNISSSHCKAPVIHENEAFKDLMNQVGEKWSIRYSLWIGNNRTVENTLTLNVPANSSFYRIMEFAAGVDNRFKFEYTVRNGKPYVYAISKTQDDPGNEMFWFLFKSSSSEEGDLELITERVDINLFPSKFSFSVSSDSRHPSIFTLHSEEGDLELITESPADVVPSDKQHLIFWYKCGSWNQ